jgi:hypothetical protein
MRLFPKFAAPCKPWPSLGNELLQTLIRAWRLLGDKMAPPLDFHAFHAFAYIFSRWR